MMAVLVGLLKPVLLPLLRLKDTPPHLPEGVALVRHLKPADAWLGLRYAGVVAGTVPQLIAVAVGLSASSLTAPRAVSLLFALTFVFVVLVIAASLVTARIDFELRHYLVGDRSLRITHGALVRREVTLSYANVQNLEVLQGPLERLFGIKSLRVSTAGGEQVAGRPSSHEAVLAGIADADAVRTLILAMVKEQRDQGLGEIQPVSSPLALDSRLLGEVREAAQALREAARGRISGPPSST
jgi:membrane protein YdbS with pleckstrin-like domain